MQIDVIRYEPLALSLRHFKIFPTASLIFTATKLFHLVMPERAKLYKAWHP